MDDFQRERLNAVFVRFGELQQAVSEQGMQLSLAKPELLSLIRTIAGSMPPDNPHIWDQIGQWMTEGWTTAQQYSGWAAAEEWRQLIVEYTQIRQGS